MSWRILQQEQANQILQKLHFLKMFFLVVKIFFPPKATEGAQSRTMTMRLMKLK